MSRILLIFLFVAFSFTSAFAEGTSGSADSGQIPSPSDAAVHAELQKSLIAGAKAEFEGIKTVRSCDDFSTTSPDLLTRAEDGDMNAQFDLGGRYLSGYWVERNTKAGIEWLTKAAEQGEPQAAAALMDAYSKVNDVKDEEKAYFWKLISGPRLYNDGGPPAPEEKLSAERKSEIEKKAASWRPSPGPNANKYDPVDTILSVPCRAVLMGDMLDSAADEGDPYSQVAFGKFLSARTPYDPPNYARAYVWFSLAARKLDFAVSARDEAGKHLTPEAKVAADKYIAEWKPRHRMKWRFPPPGPTQPGACGNYSLLLRNLKHIYINIDYSSEYEDAETCQGNEQSCAMRDFIDKKYMMGRPETAELIKKNAAEYKKRYEGIPKILFITPLATQLRSTVADALSSNSTCKLPDPLLLDSSQSFSLPQSATDALTITLKVEFDDSAPGRIAVLALTYYRADSGYATYYYSRPLLMAIPLSLPEDQMKAALADFFKGSMQHLLMPL